MKMNKTIKKLGVGIAIAAASLTSVLPAFAATTVVVKPSNTQGWSAASTNSGGDVDFVNDSTAPSGSGALQLETDSTTTAKAQYMHAAPVDTTLASVTELSYSTKQVSASFEGGAPSYQLPVDLNGAATGGFTTLVYEPYQNGTVISGEWQSWDVDAGQFWSSRTFSESGCVVTAGGGGAPFYTIADLKTACPNAVVLGFGVNIGSSNPGYVVEADLVSFNETIYDFEPNVLEDCKKDGYKNLEDGDGNPFKNQGKCVSYFDNIE